MDIGRPTSGRSLPDDFLLGISVQCRKLKISSPFLLEKFCGCKERGDF